MRRRIEAAVLVLLLLLQPMLPGAAAADDTTIHIRTASDLLELAEHCTLDSWSRGKTVSLEQDIDLSGTEFSSIPTFGGTFLGNGHKIQGYSLTSSGSTLGFFRYIQPTGVVQDLVIEGTVSPSGSRSTVGGLAGSNQGTVSGCRFLGTVSGEQSVGGLIGCNESSGQVSSSIFQGSVTGSHTTGGIAGENLGTLLRCQNQGTVNATQVDPDVNLDALSLDTLEPTQALPVCTDTGGIAGLSHGLIQSCTNNGTVGYPHTGYNVGGIAGRQSGVITGCMNNGTVYGRKDVGGIAGQAEPYLLLRYDQSTFQQLLDALDELQRLTTSSLSHADAQTQAIGTQLGQLSTTASSARTHAQTLSDQMRGWGESAVGTVNDLSARTTWLLEQMDPVLQDSSDAFDGLTEMADVLSDALENGSLAAACGSDAADTLAKALADLRRAVSEGEQAAQDAADALEACLHSLDLTSLQKLQNAIQHLAQAREQIHQAVRAIADALRTAHLDELADAFAQIADGLQQSTAALKELVSALLTLKLTPDPAELQKAAALMEQAGAHLHTAAQQTVSGLRVLRQTARTLAESGDALHDMMDGLSNAAEHLSYSFDTFSDAAQSLQRTAQELAERPTLSLPSLDAALSQSSDQLFSSVGTLLDDCTALTDQMQSASDTLLSDLQAINAQLGKIINLLRSLLTEQQTDATVSSVYEDISAQANSAVDTTGTISYCRNAGLIEGDLDVGGTAGSMSIELDFDPEDDLNQIGSRSTHLQFQTRAVLRDNVNLGAVTSKKNAAGGIVGRMDLGLVTGCEGYGPVTSTDGSYTGGIAGVSNTTIQDSWAKCRLSGGQYVGGIAGFGHDLTNCHSLITLDQGTECLGAIAGQIDGEAKNCTYVHDSLAAIDGISYDGAASPIAYDALLALPEVPSAFHMFSLTCKADGTTLAVLPFSYGEAVDRSRLPAIPEKAGFTASWPETDLSHLIFDLTLEAVYTPYTTVLEATPDREDLPHTLIEGAFAPQTNARLLGESDGSYTLSLTGPTPDSYTIRVRTDGRKTVELRQTQGWRQTDSTQDGSYLVFPVQGDTVTFRLVTPFPWIPVLACVGGGGLLLLFLLHRRRRKRREPAAAEVALQKETKQ